MTAAATSERTAIAALLLLRADRGFVGTMFGYRVDMSLRWYSTVIDCHDVRAQARWWAEAIGWKAVYESDDEVVLVPEFATEELLALTPWDHVGPGLVFVRVPDDKTLKNRLHIDLAPHISDDREAEIERLVGMGATRVDIGQSAHASWDVFADREGNEFCVLSSREM